MSDVCIIKKLHRYFSPVTLHNGDQLHKGAGTGVEDENLASDSDYFYLKLIVICLNYKNKWVSCRYSKYFFISLHEYMINVNPQRQR